LAAVAGFQEILFISTPSAELIDDLQAAVLELLQGRGKEKAMSIERAMTAVFKGPEVKKLKVYDHEFNVKPAEIVRSGGEVTANGQISHHLSMRTDDQVYYTIVKDKERNEVKTMKIEISRGGLAPVLAPLIAVAAAYVGKPVPPNKVEEVGRMIGSQIEGRWEEVAQVLVTNIGLRL
jgi:hypothetical protein